MAPPTANSTIESRYRQNFPNGTGGLQYQGSEFFNNPEIREIHRVFAATTAYVSILGESFEEIIDNSNKLTTSLYDIEKTVTDGLASEANRAIGAENTLNIYINNEFNRATGAETTLTTNLATEVGRATGAEITLTTNLATEVGRATGTETTLTTNLSTVTKNLDEILDRSNYYTTNSYLVDAKNILYNGFVYLFTTTRLPEITVLRINGTHFWTTDYITPKSSPPPYIPIQKNTLDSNALATLDTSSFYTPPSATTFSRIIYLPYNDLSDLTKGRTQLELLRLPPILPLTFTLSNSERNYSNTNNHFGTIFYPSKYFNGVDTNLNHPNLPISYVVTPDFPTDFYFIYNHTTQVTVTGININTGTDSLITRKYNNIYISYTTNDILLPYYTIKESLQSTKPIFLIYDSSLFTVNSIDTNNFFSFSSSDNTLIALKDLKFDAITPKNNIIQFVITYTQKSDNSVHTRIFWVMIENPATYTLISFTRNDTLTNGAFGQINNTTGFATITNGKIIPAIIITIFQNIFLKIVNGITITFADFSVYFNRFFDNNTSLKNLNAELTIKNTQILGFIKNQNYYFNNVLVYLTFYFTIVNKQINISSLDDIDNIIIYLYNIFNIFNTNLPTSPFTTITTPQKNFISNISNLYKFINTLIIESSSVQSNIQRNLQTLLNIVYYCNVINNSTRVVTDLVNLNLTNNQL